MASWGRMSALEGVTIAPECIHLHNSVERPLHTSLRSSVSGVRIGGHGVASTLYGLYVGGYSNDNASNAPKNGVSYMNANNDVTNSNTNIGGRLTRILCNAYSELTVTLAAAEAFRTSLKMGSNGCAGEKSAIFQAGLVPRGNARYEDKGPGAMQ